MGRILDYEINNGTCCSEIKIDGGDRILISVTQSGLKISKVSLGSIISANIWESDNQSQQIFGEEIERDGHFLNFLLAHLLDCKSTGEIRKRLAQEPSEKQEYVAQV